jgi:hypothetical protein
MLPAGLVDALGAAAFAAGTAGLAIASADQAVQNGTSGVGFPLSGALVALPHLCTSAFAPLAICCRPANLSSGSPVVDAVVPCRSAHISSSVFDLISAAVPKRRLVCSTTT